MSAADKCPPFWVDSPHILLTEAKDFFPFHDGARRCTSTALNSFTRFGIYLGLILVVLTNRWIYFMLTVGIALLSAAAFYGMKRTHRARVGSEGFQDAAQENLLPRYPDNALIVGSEADGKYVNDVIGQGQPRTEPTPANPFMNVLLTEIGDDPMRPPAQNQAFLKRQFSNQFQDKVYGDPGDVFQKTQDQRVWVVQPNTSIPNDQESFQNWLYRVPGRTCKEGNTAVCKTGTDGSSYVYFSQA
jgi:hypothetical protein